MENEEKKKMKYVPPAVEAMKFEPGSILTSSVGASSGGWNLDNGGSSNPSTGASSGGWGIDNSGSGSTGASTGGWSKD